MDIQEAFARMCRFVGKRCPEKSCIPCDENAEAINIVSEALERARVVGVLDAWAVNENYVRFGTNYDGQGLCVLVRGLKGDRLFYGITPDAARKAAANAIEKGDV